MNKILLYIFFLTSLLISDYYISESGLGTNSGTSIDSPWNFDKLVSELDGLASNSVIKFRKGDRYFGQIILTGASKIGLNFTCYEDPSNTSSKKPIIDGSILQVVGSNFDDDDNGYRVYDFSSDNIPSDFKFTNVTINDNQLVMAREPDIKYDINNLPYDDFATIYSVSGNVVSSSNLDLLNYNDYNDGAEAEFVSKLNLYSYKVAKIIESTASTVTLDDAIGFKKNYGFFVQNHFKCLDEEYEWYIDPVEKKLYLCSDVNLGTNDVVYISGFKIDDPNTGENESLKSGSGFYIEAYRSDLNYEIENLEFQNMQNCILINNIDASIAPPYKNTFIDIKNNTFRNSVGGINNYYSNEIDILGNEFIDLNRQGIISRGNNIRIDDDVNQSNFDNIGLLIGIYRESPIKDSKNNYIIDPALSAIQTSGNNITIQNNYITDVGYCGIKFSSNTNGLVEQDENFNSTTGILIYNNDIINAMHSMCDGGGIYTWRTFGDYSNQENYNVITTNRISNCNGSLLGVPGVHVYNTNSAGIYLDALTSFIKLDGNIITSCNRGINASTGKGYIFTNNTIANSLECDFNVELGKVTTNGGLLNQDDDIVWGKDEPPFISSGLVHTDTYTYIDDLGISHTVDNKYYWNNNYQAIFSTRPHDVVFPSYVYIRQAVGDFKIESNRIIGTGPIDNPDYHNFIFGTWHKIDNNTLKFFTGLETNQISSNCSTNGGIPLSVVKIELHTINPCIIKNMIIESRNSVGRVSLTPTINENSELNKVDKFTVKIIDGQKIQ